MAYKPNNNGPDQYELVTNNIVAALEKGVAPWICPWDRSLGLPQNGHTGRAYSGINVWMCWASGLGDPRWFTFNQVKEYGTSHVRKGEHGTRIVHWAFFDKKVSEKDSTGKEVERVQRIPSLKTFVIFNFSQIEWDAEKMPKAITPLDKDVLESCTEAAALVKNTGATVEHGGSMAAYSPAQDKIVMPAPGAFESAEGYWATLLHEMIHWTGHTSRCNRKLDTRFGTESYAAEELVAELGSAFLCAELGIQGKLQHTNYLGTWIKILKGDKFALFTASKFAKQAVSFLKGAAEAEESEETSEEQVA
jgi:antirestriction protein ArdC